MAKPLTKMERKVLLQFFDDLDQRFSAAGSNDLMIEATEESIKFCEAVDRFHQEDDPERELRDFDSQYIDEGVDYFYLYDFVTLNYLKSRLEEIWEDEDKAATMKSNQDMADWLLNHIGP